MKRFIPLVALTTLLASTAQALPDRAGDFALLDTEGTFHQLSRYRHLEAVVLMSFDASCAAMDQAVDQMQSLQAQWADNQVAFALINSAQDQDLATLQAARNTLGADLPLLIDDGQLVSETLQFTSAGEVTVLDPQRLNLLYRGPLADSGGPTL